MLNDLPYAERYLITKYMLWITEDDGEDEAHQSVFFQDKHAGSFVK